LSNVIFIHFVNLDELVNIFHGQSYFVYHPGSYQCSFGYRLVFTSRCGILLDSACLT
jgi:hypothetical protein